MEFEWDPDKSNANLKKHGISFHEASAGDPEEAKTRMAMIGGFPVEELLAE